MESRLRDWFPKGDDGVRLRIPEGASSESIASLKAEHVDAYRTGYAFTYASHELDLPQCGEIPRRVAYAEGIMAWVAGEDNTLVNSIDLRTGQKRSFLSEAEIAIDAIAMSSSMVVALGPVGCDIWSLTTGESHFLRYEYYKPTLEHGLVSVSDESFAIAYPKYAIDEDCGFEVLTWTLKDQRPSLFFLAIPTESTTSKIMLDSNGETLLFFYFSLPRWGAPMHFYYSRTKLDGDVLAQGVIETPSLGYYHDCSEYSVPKEANGRAVIWSFAKNQRGLRNYSELMVIYYNFQENRLEIREHMVDGLGMNLNTTSHLFYWKDAAYSLNYDHEQCVLRVVDLQFLTCREAKMGIPNSSWDLRIDDMDFEPLLFGDETFFITAFGLGFFVWCFDKNIQLFNEDIFYTENRTETIRKPLDMKRGR